MRGKGYNRRAADPVFGITPAYAGKSQGTFHRCLQCKDHPRLCGEKGFFKSLLNFEKGSPPPMRGKVKFKTDLFSFSRITPAYAGKSLAIASGWSPVGDHPRLCGEKSLYTDNRVIFKRITPAYAGKSFSSSETAVSRWDHPRLCGEKENNS